jgi:pimeloyl-ACP methyl ester carboxylesterase
VSNDAAYLSRAYLINVGQEDFWNKIGGFDPIPQWQKLRVPALALYGENDTNVDARESADKLRSLGKPNIAVEVYGGSGHALEDPPGQGDRIFREDALARIAEFVHESSSIEGKDGSRGDPDVEAGVPPNDGH